MLKETWNYLNNFELTTPVSSSKAAPFMFSPFKIVLINVAYLAFIYKIGPALMRSREPFQIKKILFVYNLLQMILNFIPLGAGILLFGYYRVYEVTCMMVLPENHPNKSLEIMGFYTYGILKFIDYLDTIFFVLRKSTRQITFLHVYHHVMMANFGYLYLRYFGSGGHIGTMGILNCLVHIFMYYYYLVSAMKPSMKNSLWWKKYITRLQLVQFGIIFVHNMYPLCFREDCKYPKGFFMVAIFQSLFMLYLFGKFYINAYIKVGNDKKKIVTKNGLNGLKTN